MKITDTIAELASKTARNAQEHSPEILVVSGVVGLLAAGILACKATTKAPEKIEKAKEKIEEVKESHEVELIDDQEYKKEITKSYMKLAAECIKLYAGPVIIATLSAAAIFESNSILKKRNASLAAAYASLDGAFKFYRKNVKEKYGEEEDQRMLTGAKEETITEEVVDENGKKKKQKKNVNVVDPYGLGNSYAMIFGDFPYDHPMHSDTYCASDIGDNYNLSHLMAVQNYLNDKLRADGMLTLNDLRDELGFRRTKQGQMVGWVRDSAKGDGYIDLRINDNFYYRNDEGELVKGILIDPNVEGYILDRTDIIPEV